MIEGEAWLALKSRLDDWIECSVSQPDALFEPDASKPYIIAQFVGLYAENQVMQWDCGEEYRGLLNLSVCVPVGWTMAQHLGLANRAGAMFAGGDIYTYDDCNVHIYERARVIGTPRLDGAHNRLEVQIPWRSWYDTSAIIIPTIRIASGSGYAGSIYSSNVFGQWYADGVAIPGVVSDTFTMPIELEGAAINQEGSNTIEMLMPRDLGLFDFDGRVGKTVVDGRVSTWTDRGERMTAYQTTASNQMLDGGTHLVSTAISGMRLSASLSPLFDSYYNAASGMGIVMREKDGDSLTYPNNISAGTPIIVETMSDSTNGGRILVNAESVITGVVRNLHLTGIYLILPTSVTLAHRLLDEYIIGESYLFNRKEMDRGIEGNVYRALIAPFMLNTADRQKAEGVIAHAQGFASLLPDNHPYKTLAPRVQ